MRLLDRWGLRSLIAAALIVVAGAAAAQEAAPAAGDGTVLRIGTRMAPPFAMKGVDGRWEGVSIALLAAMAARMGFRYELVETSLPGMVDDVAAGRLDGSIAAMSITEDREKVIDFSNPYFHSGLGVAVAAEQRATVVALLEALGSKAFLATMGTLTLLLLVVGGLIWLAERWRNSREFERNPAKGLFSGFWWAAVTMTTVGYGDKTPITVLGRLLGVVWMFSALILTSLVIAQLSATLTAERIQSRIHKLSDLSRVKVGNVDGAASLEALQTIGVRPRAYPDVETGLEALAAGSIDAFVHDEPILVWLKDSVEGISIAPLRFAPENYAIVLPEGSPHREAINQSLLDVLASDQWTETLRYYLTPEG
jgi:ABC-type amino acid transport substrate-binding protein